MDHFYSFLLKHHFRPGAAVRQAQIRMMKDGKWGPYHWAGFMFQGTGRPTKAGDLATISVTYG